MLKDGRLQQCDTPRNLYEHPCNVFVAGFVGSPAMNLDRLPFDGTAVHIGDTPIPLPGAAAADARPVGSSPRSSLAFEPNSLTVVTAADGVIHKVTQWKAEPELPGSSGGGHRLRRLDPTATLPGRAVGRYGSSLAPTPVAFPAWATRSR